MSEKLDKPRTCQEAGCNRLVYVWANRVLDYEADYFESRPCTCPLGRAVAKEQERASRKQALATEQASKLVRGQ